MIFKTGGRSFPAHGYQKFAIGHILENPFCGLFLDMGLGKTVSTLTALHIMKARKEFKRVLVIGPKRVIEKTWPDELRKWQHLAGLSMSIIAGTEKQRLIAMQSSADIHCVSRDNIAWLVAQFGGGAPYDILVIDELSSFKDDTSARFKALRQMRPRIKRVIGLTGTPAPNSLLDLWPQMYLIDMGQRLGKRKKEYRETYFNPGKRRGETIFNYILKKGGDLEGEDIFEAEIYDKVRDICVSMKAVDYLDLPGVIEQKIEVSLSDSIMRRYEIFEEEAVLEILERDGEITAMNAAALTNKLLQFAGGAVYDNDKKVVDMHREKVDAAIELVEEAQGQPVMIFYWFQHERERLLRAFKKYGVRVLESDKDIDDWNAGKISVMLVHPQGAGHGLNLQDGGHIIVWYACIWSLELYAQANARLNRQGQTKVVRLYRIVATGTMDEAVVERLDKKEAGQQALLDAVKAIFDKYIK